MSHSHASPSCNHVCIAQSGVGDVAICPDCGVVHVNLNYFSMRFEVNTFRMVAQMLAQAQNRIDSTAQAFAMANDNTVAEAQQAANERIH